MILDYPHFKTNSNFNSPLLIPIGQTITSFSALSAHFDMFSQMNKHILGPQSKSLKKVLEVVHMIPYSNNVLLKRWKVVVQPE